MRAPARARGRSCTCSSPARRAGTSAPASSGSGSRTSTVGRSVRGRRRLYSALDAYVVPSRQEGGPKSVLEAMASGVPIVSTRVGQATELIRDGENGRLVEVEDAEALAEALRTIAFRRSSPPGARRRSPTQDAQERSGAHSSTGSSRMRDRDSLGGARPRSPRPQRARAPTRHLAAADALGRDSVDAAARRGAIAVSYGLERMPSADDVVYGGHVKFSLLDEELPNAPRDFNVLYLGSSALPLEAGEARRTRSSPRRGIRVEPERRRVSRLVRRGLAARQRASRASCCMRPTTCSSRAPSASSRPTGSTASGKGHGRCCTIRWTRAASSRPRGTRPLTLLLGGNQYQRYRLETALAATRSRPPRTPRGRDSSSRAPSRSTPPEGLHLFAARPRHAVEFVGPVHAGSGARAHARADMLLHTKYNDPCPTVVLEAMASGLPVVHSNQRRHARARRQGGRDRHRRPARLGRDHPPPPSRLGRRGAPRRRAPFRPLRGRPRPLAAIRPAVDGSTAITMSLQG